MFTLGLLKHTKVKLCISSILRRADELRKDERGNILIMAAFTLPVMIGAMGLGAEASYRYQQQRKIQHAADVAVHGAGIRKAFGDTKVVYEPVGRMLAVNASWDEASGGQGGYELNDIPTNGVYAGQTTGPAGGTLVEVILRETVPRLFSQMYGGSDITVSAYAVAEVLQKKEACVLALDGSAPRAMNFSGNASLTLSGCEIASNSSASDAIYQGGSSNVTADCINAVGQIDQSSGVTLTECPAARINQPMIQDPYAKIDEPDPGLLVCKNWSSVSGGNPRATLNINPSQWYDDGEVDGYAGAAEMFCGQNISMKQRINLGSGLYILNGVDLSVNANAIVSGSEIMFYMVNGGSVTINGSGQLNLSAMTTGPWKPMLFFSSRSNTATSHQINGNSSSSFEGVMYFPNDSLDYNGGAGISGACTQVIANTVSFSGNSDFRSDCTSYPFADITTNALVQLID